VWMYLPLNLPNMSWLTTDSVKVARVYCFVANILFAVGLFFSRISISQPNTVNLIRGIGCVLGLVLYSKLTGESIMVRDWKKFDWVILRSVITSIPSILTVFAIQHIKISVFAISTRVEMIFIYLLGIKYMGNKFDWKILIAGASCIIGVVLVIAPSLFGLGDPDSNTLELHWTPSEIVGIILLLLWLIVDVLQVLISSKVMGMMTPTQAVFYLNMMITINSSLAIILTDGKTDFHFSEIPIYIAMVLIMILAQLVISETFRVEKNIGVISVINCNYLVATMILDVIFLGTQVSLVNVVGSLLVACGSVMTVIIKA
jgi:drug/metabolite transporter (DMT)-like permease